MLISRTVSAVNPVCMADVSFAHMVIIGLAAIAIAVMKEIMLHIEMIAVP